MEVDKRLWSMYDGRILTAAPAGLAEYAYSWPRDYGNSQRSGSTSSASSTSSTNPLTSEKAVQPFKVPLHVAAALAQRGFDVDEAGKVTWRRDSQSHPRNWSATRKTYDAAVIIFLEFFTTLVSNTGSSTAAEGAADLGVSREVALMCFTTTYLLSQAVGGMVLPPIAETFGGRTIYMLGSAGFTLSCVVMAVVPTLPCVAVGRSICGFMSALPTTVAVSSFENMFDTRARIWVLHIWISSAVAALGMGPPVATYVSTSALRWPWVFCFSAMIAGLSTLLCPAMKESRPSSVLRHEIRAVQRSSGFTGLTSESADAIPSFKAFCESSLLLPVRLFFTEPIVFFTSVMAATVCAVVYVFPEAFPVVFVDGYGFDHRQCALVNLSISAGVLFTVLPRLYDLSISNRCRRMNVLAEPEDKMFGFLVAAPLLAIAFWWFSFTIPPLNPGVSPLVPIASLLIVGFSVVEFDTVLAGYLTDTYTSYAASANASLSFLRAVLSGILPVFSHGIFSMLGPNYAMFILAGIASLYCVVALVFAKFGKKIRLKSKFAQISWEATKQSNQGLSARAVA